MCCACDQETVKWQDGEARVNLELGHANCSSQQELQGGGGLKKTVRIQINLVLNGTSAAPEE